ncbi:MAG: hypothetical protein NC433_14215 [Clostridiales bacterium]|nr:hypothetical protein [Clostridiales bacterium]
MQEEIKNTPDSEIKDLGVIVEISKDTSEAQRISETVSFYGASMTKEQSDKLQSVIKDLEEQLNGNLGDSWNVGAYAQLGLKVSQLSYACKEIGLSDEAAEQVTSTYGKQAEEKINKISNMMESAAKLLRISRVIMQAAKCRYLQERTRSSRS